MKQAFSSSSKLLKCFPQWEADLEHKVTLQTYRIQTQSIERKITSQCQVWLQEDGLILASLSAYKRFTVWLHYQDESYGVTGALKQWDAPPNSGEGWKGALSERSEAKILCEGKKKLEVSYCSLVCWFGTLTIMAGSCSSSSSCDTKLRSN